MTYQKAGYASFLVFVALMSAATFITWQNDLILTNTARWITLGAIPFFTVGFPTFIVQHSGLWKE